jgi:hypothetical protein
MPSLVLQLDRYSGVQKWCPPPCLRNAAFRQGEVD